MMHNRRMSTEEIVIYIAKPIFCKSNHNGEKWSLRDELNHHRINGQGVVTTRQVSFSSVQT